MKYLTYIILLILPTILVAEPLTVPNTFVAGQPAVAADVNENFTVVTTEVNNLIIDVATTTAAIEEIQTTKLPYVVDANGAEIGILIGASDTSYDIITHRDYIILDVNTTYGSGSWWSNSWRERKTVYYEETDCYGQPHASVSSGMVIKTAKPPTAPHLSLPQNYYYIPKNTPAQILRPKSMHIRDTINNSFGVCENIPIILTDPMNEPITPEVVLWMIFPNDPAVTGVPNIGYNHPLSVEIKNDPYFLLCTGLTCPELWND